MPAVDLFLRQGLIGGKRVPVIWGSGISFNLLKNLHELADADIGEFGLATDLLPEVQSHDQAATIPWAVRYMKCSDDARDICNEEPKYCTQCWVDRDDGIVPDNKLLAKSACTSKVNKPIADGIEPLKLFDPKMKMTS